MANERAPSAPGEPGFSERPSMRARAARALERLWADVMAREPQRLVLLIASVGVILYSFSVLWVVTTSGDIGIRCVFGTTQKAPINTEYTWFHPELGREVRSAPQEGDRLRRVEARDGRWAVELRRDDYASVIRAQRLLSHMESRDEVLVTWSPRSEAGEELQAVAVVRQRPFTRYVWSLVWFLQEMVIFGIGAFVFWNRPRDRSAQVFFWLCAVTVAAYMGGYHWSEIVVARPLIFLFVPLVMLVPVLSLHFYLVFPRPNPLLLLHRRAVLAALYGIPAACLLTLWTAMGWLTLTNSGIRPGVVGDISITDERLLAQGIIKWVSLGYVGYAVVIFSLCIAFLVYSFRRARNRAERNQVRWILMASIVAIAPITYLLRMTVEDTATLGLDKAAWPMYVVSLLYTSAYAVSITRYKLLQIEEIFHRSLRYVLVSVALGVVYSLVLVLGAFSVGASIRDDRTSREGIVVGVTALVILGLSGAVRQRFEQAIGKRFFREKYQFDRAMRKMSRAVDRLVDRGTLGDRLLEAAAEVLGLDWGAIYLREAPDQPYQVVASLGPEPEARALEPESPLLRKLESQSILRLPGPMSRNPADTAADALIALGCEVAAALESEDQLDGVLVLGPKRNGLPYDDEELVFLGALSSVAALAIRSASIHSTLEVVNRELRDKVEKIAEQQRRIMILQDQLASKSEAAASAPAVVAPEAFERIKGQSPAIRVMVETVRKAALSPSAVLITGESGTGKELIAEAIHAASPRSDGPFVKVHCAALSASLLESELFGHVRGAFTGADRDRVGRFEQADGGTLLLDEIGDISPEVQVKLLRVLQTKSFERVGSSQPIEVDVRIVAATNRDLAALIRDGRFREDLFYRLNVIGIRTPSLRERREDIFELALTFLQRSASRLGKPIAQIEDEVIDAFEQYDWPGNIRELENVLERAVALAEGPSVTKDDLPPEIFDAPARRASTPKPVTGRRGRRRIASQSSPPPADLPDPELEAFERHQLLDALKDARGNKSAAARLLGMPRSTLVSKLKKHGLMEPNEPRPIVRNAPL